MEAFSDTVDHLNLSNFINNQPKEGFDKCRNLAFDKKDDIIFGQIETINDKQKEIYVVAICSKKVFGLRKPNCFPF